MFDYTPAEYSDDFARDTMRAANALSYGAEPECDELTAAAARVYLRLESMPEAGWGLTKGFSDGRLNYKVYVPAR